MSRILFSEPNELERRIEADTAAGMTVYVSNKVLKVKFGNDTLRFDEFTKIDSSLGKPVPAGGIFSTTNQAEIDRIDSIRDLGVRKFKPAPPEESKPVKSPK